MITSQNTQHFQIPIFDQEKVDEELLCAWATQIPIQLFIYLLVYTK